MAFSASPRTSGLDLAHPSPKASCAADELRLPPKSHSADECSDHRGRYSLTAVGCCSALSTSGAAAKTSSKTSATWPSVHWPASQDRSIVYSLCTPTVLKALTLIDTGRRDKCTILHDNPTGLPIAAFHLKPRRGDIPASTLKSSCSICPCSAFVVIPTCYGVGCAKVR